MTQFRAQLGLLTCREAEILWEALRLFEDSVPHTPDRQTVQKMRRRAKSVFYAMRVENMRANVATPS